MPSMYDLRAFKPQCFTRCHAVRGLTFLSKTFLKQNLKICFADGANGFDSLSLGGGGGNFRSSDAGGRTPVNPMVMVS